MSDVSPKGTWQFDAGDLDGAHRFLKRCWSELRALRRVRIWSDRVRVYDVNGDCFELTGVGYADPSAPWVLDQVNANYDRQSLSQPTGEPYKEYLTGRRYNWAQDRVM
jgi:hypothetical protein